MDWEPPYSSTQGICYVFNEGTYASFAHCEQHDFLIIYYDHFDWEDSNEAISVCNEEINIYLSEFNIIA